MLSQVIKYVYRSKTNDIPHLIMSKSVCQRPYQNDRGVQQMLVKDGKGGEPKDDDC